MRTLFLIVAVLFAVRAEAITPDGCYVTFDNPGSCYHGGITTVYNVDQDNVYHYGDTVGELVSDYRNFVDLSVLRTNQLAACNSDFNSQAATLSACTNSLNQKTASLNQCSSAFSSKDSDYNTCANNYLGLYNFSQGQATAMKKLNSTIRTLKRKCGSRCR